MGFTFCSNDPKSDLTELVFRFELLFILVEDLMFLWFCKFIGLVLNNNNVLSDAC